MLPSLVLLRLCMLDLEFVYLDMMSVNVKNKIGNFHPQRSVEFYSVTDFLRSVCGCVSG